MHVKFMLFKKHQYKNKKIDFSPKSKLTLFFTQRMYQIGTVPFFFQSCVQQFLSDLVSIFTSILVLRLGNMRIILMRLRVIDGSYLFMRLLRNLILSILLVLTSCYWNLLVL